MRFQYRHPKFYDFLISFIYSPKLMARLSDEVGRNNSVFDVAAGYGRVSKFIDSSNSYYGIDRNTFFIKHGRDRGLKLDIKDIFDPKSYTKSDIFLVIDIIHHLSKEKIKALFDIIFQNTVKKVIVIEPSFVDVSSKYGIFGKLIGWFFKKVDDDGFNKIVHWFGDREYSEMFNNRFGSEEGKNFSVSCEIISAHYLVVFNRI